MKPMASADFLMVVQTLPEWLQDIAVISNHWSHVNVSWLVWLSIHWCTSSFSHSFHLRQNVLTYMIAIPFPTMILIASSFLYALIYLKSPLETQSTFSSLIFKIPSAINLPLSVELVIITLVCSSYFPLHEVVQIVSFMALGNFLAWVWNMGNQQCKSCS
jgi:hypothetical protein